MKRALRQRELSASLFLLVAALVSCENAGADRTIGLSATGIVRGTVYFDANGSQTQDAEDVLFPGAGVRLLSPVSRDTLFRATTGVDGSFRLAGVPVGSYAVVIDRASAGDSARVVGVSAPLVRVLPGDSVQVSGSISFLHASAAQVRTLALGTRVFVTGVALNARSTFSDTLLHVVDTSGAIRATRVRPSAVTAGDSVRLRGRVSTRLGQRALDDVSVFIVAPTFVPTAPTITTAVAATAAAGTLDAKLVMILNAGVTDTATVSGHLTMTVNDGSGAVRVFLDRAADPTFRAPLPPALFVAPNRFDIVGVLVPTGTGAWRIRPRSALDLTRR